MVHNISVADFSKRSRDTRVSPPLYQWDYGQILHIIGLNLPQAYEVHFSNEQTSGEAETHVTDSEYIAIPDKYLETGTPIYVFICLHETDSDSETEYTITIPVLKRPKPVDYEPTPTEESIIDEAIVALNNAVTQVAESAEAAKESAKESASYKAKLINDIVVF